MVRARGGPRPAPGPNRPRRAEAAIPTSQSAAAETLLSWPLLLDLNSGELTSLPPSLLLLLELLPPAWPGRADREAEEAEAGGADEAAEEEGTTCCPTGRTLSREGEGPEEVAAAAAAPEAEAEPEAASSKAAWAAWMAWAALGVGRTARDDDRRPAVAAAAVAPLLLLLLVWLLLLLLLFLLLLLAAAVVMVVMVVVMVPSGRSSEGDAIFCCRLGLEY